MPPNFHVVIENKLAGMGEPSQNDIDKLKRMGFVGILSLTERQPHFRAEGLVHTHIPIKDFTAPKIDDLIMAIRFIRRVRGPVAVHCASGNGRTGTILAAYLIYNFRISANSALKFLRTINPNYVETREQEYVLHLFEAIIEQNAEEINHWKKLLSYQKTLDGGRIIAQRDTPREIRTARWSRCEIRGFSFRSSLRVNFDSYNPHVEVDGGDNVPVDHLELDEKLRNSINLIKALLLRGIYIEYRDGEFYLSDNNNFRFDVGHVKNLLEGYALGKLERSEKGYKIIPAQSIDYAALTKIMRAVSHEFGGQLYGSPFASFFRREHGFKVPAFCIDPCISKLVRSLNAAGFATHISCEGHGRRKAFIQFFDRNFAIWFWYVFKEVPDYLKGGWRMDDRNITKLVFSSETPFVLELFNQSYTLGEHFYLNRKYYRQLKKEIGDEIVRIYGKFMHHLPGRNTECRKNLNF